MSAPVNINIEKFMNEFGHFGTSGVIAYIFLSIPVIYSTFAASLGNYILEVDSHRCLIPECENKSIVVFDTPWLPNATLVSSVMCKRYKPLNSSRTNYSICPATWFDHSTEIPCEKDDLVYQYNEDFIMKDMGLQCEEVEVLNTIPSYIQFVEIIGFLSAGFLADMFGRKPVIILFPLVASIFGFLQYFSWNYIAFLTFHGLILISSFGAVLTAIVLGLEMVGLKARMLSAVVIGGYYSLSSIMTAFIVNIRWKWRTYCFFYLLYPPCTIVLYWMIPESIRWLKIKGKENQLIKELMRMVKRKGVDISEDYLNRFRSTGISDGTYGTRPGDEYNTEVFNDRGNAELTNKNIEAQQDGEITESKKHTGIMKPGKKKEGEDLFFKKFVSHVEYQRRRISRVENQYKTKGRSKWKMLLKSKYYLLRLFILCIFVWTSLSVVVSSAAGHLTGMIEPYGTKYTHKMLSAILKLISFISLPELTFKFGRKKSFAAAQIISGFLFLIFPFYEDKAMKTVLYYVLQIISGISLGCLSIYTNELLPTELRMTLFSIFYSFTFLVPTFGFLWTMFEKILENLTLYIFSGFIIVAGLLIFLFPETSKQKLPDTVEEAEKLTNVPEEESEQLNIQQFK